jgi:hypothetical protein
MHLLSDLEAAQCIGACRRNLDSRPLARNRGFSAGEAGSAAMRLFTSIAITIIQINNSFNLVVNGGSIVSSQANGVNSATFL